MLKTVRDDTKSKSLNLCFDLFWSIPICENPGEVDHFGDPATIFLLFEFHRELHSRQLASVQSYRFLLFLKRPLRR